MQTIIIPGTMPGLNEYITQLNGNRWSGNRMKQDQTSRVVMECRICRALPVAHYPVTIEYDWYVPDRRKDLDNISWAKKLINDGLVVAGILTDDSQKYVAGFTDRFHIDKHNPRILVTIRDAIE